ncbi:hypothetical protein B0T24DRAFT_249173 [Lasiosphaeria ovina]|uniref:Uncharacterized protein n=1 Tax=Lasiosphaeria ovina TaxID=92902 RepID=A0AAE0N7E6_9PEZI|nr:hypothetical protein B0T24DRAFT_249173 [Lasiosphaeria ovina]
MLSTTALLLPVLGAVRVSGLLERARVQAATSTLTASVFFPDWSYRPVLVSASIYSAGASETVYVLTCSTDMFWGDRPDPCTNFGPMVTVNPSLVHIRVRSEIDYITITGPGVYLPDRVEIRSGDISCDITSNTAKCRGDIFTGSTSYGWDENRMYRTVVTQSTSIEAYSVDAADVAATLMPVTVTAGLWKLPAPTQASTWTAGANVPRITQQALLAGAAAVLGGAVMF